MRAPPQSSLPSAPVASSPPKVAPRVIEVVPNLSAGDAARIRPPPPPAGGGRRPSLAMSEDSTKSDYSEGSRSRSLSLPAAPSSSSCGSGEDDQLFDDPDIEGVNVIYAKDEAGRRSLQAISLTKLVARITHPDGVSEEDLATVLLTHRAYISAEELLDLLIIRYMVPAPDSLRGKHGGRDRWERDGEAVRQRVYILVKRWLLSTPEEFAQNEPVADRVMQLHAEMVTVGRYEHAAAIKDALDTASDPTSPRALEVLARLRRSSSGHHIERLEPERSPQSSSPAQYLSSSAKKTSNSSTMGRALARISSNRAIGLNMDLSSSPEHFHAGDGAEFRVWSTPVRKMAEQMTVRDWAGWKRVHVRELEGLAWTKFEKEVTSPNVQHMAGSFVSTSMAVATSVLKMTDMRQRARMMSYWIDVAVELRELHNFNSMVGVISGLRHGAVWRLRKSWALVKKPRLVCLQNILTLASSERNYAELREAHKGVLPPCIPFPGLYLSDLVFIEEGNPDYVAAEVPLALNPDAENQTAPPLIHFHKYRLMARTYLEIQRLQTQSYGFSPVAAVQTWLDEAECWGEDDCYNISLQLEERPPKRSAAAADSTDDGDEGGRGLRKGLVGWLGRSKRDMDVFAAEELAYHAASLEFGPEWGAFPDDAYPFFERDMRTNITFETDFLFAEHQSGDRPAVAIRAASLVKLVQKATAPRADDTLVDDILQTYPLYASHAELLALLRQRYEPPAPLEPDLAEAFLTEFVIPVRTRVLIMIDAWVTRHFEEAATDAETVQGLLNFVSQRSDGLMRHRVEALVAMLRDVVESGRPPPKPHMPVEREPRVLPSRAAGPVPGPIFLRLEPVEVARQLTLRDCEAAQDLSPFALLRPRDRGKHEPFSRMLLGSEKLAALVCAEIRSVRDTSNCTAILAHWIRVAHELAELNNFHSAHAIVVMALEQPAVMRLREVWVRLPATERAMHASVRSRAKTGGLDTASKAPPTRALYAAPVLLHRLERLDLMPQTFGSLVNFRRHSRVGALLRLVRVGRSMPFHFVRVPLLHDFFENPAVLSSQALAASNAALPTQDASAPPARSRQRRSDSSTERTSPSPSQSPVPVSSSPGLVVTSSEKAPVAEAYAEMIARIPQQLDLFKMQLIERLDIFERRLDRMEARVNSALDHKPSDVSDEIASAPSVSSDSDD